MPAPGERLDSWKAIAAYLKRDVTTVRRWEKREGLPVHRHVHDKLGSVYAYADEIDAWSEARRAATAVGLPATESGRITPRAIAAGLLIIVVLGAVAMYFTQRERPYDRRRSWSLAVDAPPEVTLESMAISPDATQIAFTGVRPGGASLLWIRPIPSVTPAVLPGTEGATFPFWSPDGHHLGFFAGAKLKTVSISTREVRDLADAPHGRGGAWNQQGVILFAPDHNQPLFQVPAAGGAVTPVTTLPGPFDAGHAWPTFLPDGRHFVFLNAGGWPKQHGIFAGDLAGGEPRRIVAAFSSPGFTPDGYLLYVKNESTLVAQRFDLMRLEVSGEAMTIADDVLTHYSLDHKADFSVSATGELAVRHGVDGLARLVWLDRRGRELASFEDAPSFANPELARDGRSAIVTRYPSTSPVGHLWRVELASRHWSQLTFAKAIDFAPLLSPTDDRVLFATYRGKQYGFYERDLAGRGPEREFPTTPMRLMAPEAWTRDGRYLTYSAKDPLTNFDLWMLDLAGDRRPQPLLRGRHNEAQSRVSPDGALIAYTSDELGRCDVYVQRFPAGGERLRISVDGGADPRWRGDGGELYYLSSDRQLMAVSVTRAGGIQFGTPRRLLDLPVRALWLDMRNNYDVTDDGQQFLAVLPLADPRSAFVTVIVNWRDTLRGGG